MFWINMPSWVENERLKYILQLQNTRKVDGNAFILVFAAETFFRTSHEFKLYAPDFDNNEETNYLHDASVKQLQNGHVS